MNDKARSTIEMFVPYIFLCFDNLPSHQVQIVITEKGLTRRHESLITNIEEAC